MKSLGPRLFVAAVVAIMGWIALSGSSATKDPIVQPDKLIILSTTDVKGKTSPCG